MRISSWIELKIGGIKIGGAKALLLHFSYKTTLVAKYAPSTPTLLPH
jgi:hypothetical protein